MLSAQTTSAILLGLLLVAGCATTVEEHVAAQRSAKPCCLNLEGLPGPQALQLGKRHELTFESPHYDFGFGLSPFVTFATEGLQKKTVRIKVHPRGSGLLLGGDGNTRILDAKVVFLDQIGVQIVPAVELKWTGREYRGLTEDYELYAEFEVPESARKLIIGSSSTRLGSSSSTRFQSQGSVLAVSGVFLNIPAGQTVRKFMLSSYGEFSLYESVK